MVTTASLPVSPRPPRASPPDGLSYPWIRAELVEASESKSPCPTHRILECCNLVCIKVAFIVTQARLVHRH